MTETLWGRKARTLSRSSFCTKKPMFPCVARTRQATGTARLRRRTESMSTSFQSYVALVHLQDDGLAARRKLCDDLQSIGPDHLVGVDRLILQLSLDVLIAVIGRADLARQRRRKLHEICAADFQLQRGERRQTFTARFVIARQLGLEIFLNSLGQHRAYDHQSLPNQRRLLESREILPD